jgi:hypothetical protein
MMMGDGRRTTDDLRRTMDDGRWTTVYGLLLPQIEALADLPESEQAEARAELANSWRS